MIDSREAGKLLKKFRSRKGQTQQNLADNAGIPTAQYVSCLERGIYHVGNSEHLAGIVKALHLTREEILMLNPNAFVEIIEEEYNEESIFKNLHPIEIKNLTSITLALPLGSRFWVDTVESGDGYYVYLDTQDTYHILHSRSPVQVVGGKRLGKLMILQLSGTQ